MLALLLLVSALVRALDVREIMDVPEPSAYVPVHNETAFAFPRAHDWFTIGTTNYVLWDWLESHTSDLRVVLDRPDGDVDMLRGPLVLKDKIPANMFGMSYNGSLPASPGHGYRLSLRDVANDSVVYASSESFEIKGADAKPTAPVPWGLPKATAHSGAVRTRWNPLSAMGLLIVLL
ncbi:hypothetical protein CspeluHIS016_0800450 [Cutaneotrichosporon spelunceum]|uniref:Uncharacterized protein n=1 Tax=Cutaneotrichosporon spelunceum TaxID=1672016 RepID=A0AAD3YEV7_9TREE|nr:hypothetical protein CspeluHIS016_0800450 [Cutaneotrichosporon spelunceum]